MNTNATLSRTASAIAQTAVVAFALTTGVLVTACQEIETDAAPPVIIGEWVADETVCGDNSWIEMEDDLTGEARIFFYIEYECYYADFDVEVDDMDDDEYEIVFKAQDRELSGILDFDMTCDVEDDDEIECEGSDGFGGIEWVFERD